MSFQCLIYRNIYTLYETFTHHIYTFITFIALLESLTHFWPNRWKRMRYDKYCYGRKCEFKNSSSTSLLTIVKLRLDTITCKYLFLLQSLLLIHCSNHMFL